MFPVFNYTQSGVVKNSMDFYLGNEFKVYFDLDTEILNLIRLDQAIDEYIIEGCIARITL